MIELNQHYQQLAASYLFVEIGRRVRAAQEAAPGRPILKLGIGDVTRPLPASAIAALHSATDELASVAGFRGYGPEQGYPFLREAIVAHDYAPRSVAVAADEVFVSDGSKCDTGNFQELFAASTTVAVADPVYPVYVDTNIMAGRADQITYLAGTTDNGFVPPPPSAVVDLVYLCFPNNPTGAVATRAQLGDWVDWANRHGSILLFDAAYVEYIRDETIPRSIYEIPGADTCAVEFRSFSKTAGFTGLRCAYTVVPKALAAGGGAAGNLHAMWMRRQTTKFNGVAYPVQRAAEAAYTGAGASEIRQLTDFYLENSALIRTRMEELGFRCWGGDNSPYVWVEAKRPSWELFDLLLEQAGVVTTPGAGFGSAGEGFIRISGFNERDVVTEALERIGTALA